MITVTAANTSLLISPSTQDANFRIDINITIQKWRSTCHSILTGLSGASRSLNSLLQVWQSVTIYHYILLSSKNRPTTYEDAIQAPEKTPRSKRSQNPTKEQPCFNPLVPSPSKTPSASRMKVR